MSRRAVQARACAYSRRWAPLHPGRDRACCATVISESASPPNNGIGNLMLQAQAQFQVPLSDFPG